MEEIVIKFVCDYWSVGINQLSIKTKLRTDLGIDGDDALEFMESFGENFIVDLSNFDFDKYFLSESDLTNPFLVFQGNKNLSSLDIKLLIQAADARKWVDSPIQGSDFSR